MRIQLIHNPASGSHDPRRVDALRTALQAAGAEVIDGLSSPAQPCRIDRTADRVVVIGGDGTVRHVVAAIKASGLDIPLAIYPGGTVNLLHRELLSPTDPAGFAHMVCADGAIRPHYAAHCGAGRFLACASIGPDSYAVAALSERLKHLIGRLAYLVAFLNVLWRWPRPQLRLRIDGREQAAEAVFVAKGRFYAGPWSFAPAARLDAPTLQVVALPRLTRWIFFSFMLALLLGRRLPARHCVETTCRELLIDSATPVPLQADGDAQGETPVALRLDPQAYSLCRPDD